MSRGTGRWAAIALCVLVAGLGGCGGSGSETEEEAEEAPARRIAPSFELDLLSGGSVALSDLRGKTVILDFWATWCPPCEFQVPELNAFYEAHRDDAGVEVFGISVDTEGADVVAAWVAEKDVRYPVLLGRNEEVARRYGAVGFPTLFIIDPDGRVESVHVGLIEIAELESALARLRPSG